MQEVTAKVESEETRAKKRQPRSDVKFPYYDLNDAIEVARRVQDGGGGEASLNQLRGLLNARSTSSGAFRSRVAAASTFGLIRPTGTMYRVTDRALAILSPIHENDDARARVEAFLSVPLFRQTYDLYNGGPLPSEVGLKNTFKTRFSVVENSVDLAYRMFMRSAEQAGFFARGRTHLVEPIIPASVLRTGTGDGRTKDEAGGDDTGEGEQRGGTGGGRGGGGLQPPDVHPVLIGWLQLLPQKGEGWTQDQYDTWIQGFTAAIKTLHPVRGGSKG